MSDTKYLTDAGYSLFKAEQPDGTYADLGVFMRNHPDLMQAPSPIFNPTPITYKPAPPPGKPHKIFSQSPGPRKIQVGDVWLAAYSDAPGKSYHFHIIACVSTISSWRDRYWLGVKDYPIERDNFMHASWFDKCGISLDEYGEFRLYRKSRVKHPCDYWLRFHD